MNSRKCPDSRVRDTVRIRRVHNNRENVPNTQVRRGSAWVEHAGGGTTWPITPLQKRVVIVGSPKKYFAELLHSNSTGIKGQWHFRHEDQDFTQPHIHRHALCHVKTMVDRYPALPLCHSSEHCPSFSNEWDPSLNYFAPSLFVFHARGKLGQKAACSHLQFNSACMNVDDTIAFKHGKWGWKAGDNRNHTVSAKVHNRNVDSLKSWKREKKSQDEVITLSANQILCWSVWVPLATDLTYCSPPHHENVLAYWIYSGF